MNDDTQLQAGEFLARQRARGGTSLRPAVEAAYRYDDPDRVLNIVILSDGMTEEAEQKQLLQLIGQRPAGAIVRPVPWSRARRPTLSLPAGPGWE